MIAKKRSRAFEVRLYMGARKGYGNEQFRAEDVIRAITEFQEARTETDEPPIPVRISPTTFVSKSYVEPGWEIAVVRYPLREDSDEEIIAWAADLAAVLMQRFDQQQISATIRGDIVVFSRE
jgi:hypothetical protein